VLHGAAAAQALGYDGALLERGAWDWRPGSSGANSEIAGGLVWLRNRSRDLERNCPWTAKAISEWVGAIVGTGITPQSTDPRVMALWREFCERENWIAKQRLAVAAMVRDGEGVMRRRWLRGPKGGRVPFTAQVLESDFIDL
jgi:capsid protein